MSHDFLSPDAAVQEGGSAPVARSSMERFYPLHAFVCTRCWLVQLQEFESPAEIYAEWDAKQKGADAENEWNKRFAAYESEFPSLASEFKRRMAGELPSSALAGALMRPRIARTS